MGMDRRCANASEEPRKADDECGIRAAPTANNRDFVTCASHIVRKGPFPVQATHDMSKISRGPRGDQVANQSLKPAGVQAQDNVNHREASTRVRPDLGGLRVIFVVLHVACTSFIRE